MEFTFEDAEELSSLVSSQQSHVDEKRRWLESMILKPDGCIRRAKRPKILDDVYLPESYTRSEEGQCGLFGRQGMTSSLRRKSCRRQQPSSSELSLFSDPGVRCSSQNSN